MTMESSGNLGLSAVDAAAATIFAAACGFAAAAWSAPDVPTSAALPALLVSVAAFLLAAGVTRDFEHRRGFRLPAFDCAALPANWDVDRLADELLLDDALPPPPQDSRVVQLFDVRTRTSAAPTTPPDDSQAMLQALLDLRRSFH